MPEPARSSKRPTSPDADESVDRTSRRKRRPNVKAGKGKIRRNPAPAPAGRKHAPGRPANRPPTTDSASVPTADSVAAAAPVGAPLAGPPAPVGIPNFFIDEFRIPPFLLPIYQAAGMQYGVRWEILAGINEIETDYGRNLNVSSAGALGWMQFMPATWKAYGVDANRDGVKDPFNPVDAIFAAARYLKAAGADTDIRKAVFAYNHADWYVDSVLMRAQVIGGLPTDLVGSLTGLTQGRFPVRARATYADALTKADRRRKGTNPAVVVQAAHARKKITIFAKAGSRVVAVNDGKVVRIGHGKRLGRYIVLQDAYGNTYTYAHLKRIPKQYPAPKPRKVSKRSGLGTSLRGGPERESAPKAAATKTTRADVKRASSAGAKRRLAAHPAATSEPAAVVATTKVRLFAHPNRVNSRKAGGDAQLVGGFAGAPLGLDPKDFRARPLKEGAHVVGGTTIGRIGKTTKRASHLRFEIRPAGRGAPRIDPKPILDGWKLLESTAVYRAKGKHALFGTDAEEPSIGQIMLMSKETLGRRVLNNPRIEIYACGRADIRSGAIDRRVLATLEFLASSGLKPTVSSLHCGHGYLTTSGNVSEHTTGTAVDIAAVNGIPISGHQGPGSIADITIRRLLTLQGTMKPHQIISLMTYPDTDNTLALPDHDDHIHVGWQPVTSADSRGFDAVLKPSQWTKLIDRLARIDNPEIPEQP